MNKKLFFVVAIFVTMAILYGGFRFYKSKQQEKNEREICLNAALIRTLADRITEDYLQTSRRCKEHGSCVLTDIFGDEHYFKKTEDALNYCVTKNKASFVVMDSLEAELRNNLETLNNPSVELANLQKNATDYYALCKKPLNYLDSLDNKCVTLSRKIQSLLVEKLLIDERMLKDKESKIQASILAKEMIGLQDLQANRSKEAEKNRVVGEEFLANNKKQKGIVVLPNGLQYKEIKRGSGKKPTENSMVNVSYEGRFINGTVFDSSSKSNKGKPSSLSLNDVIRGWAEALKLMPVGSIWEIYVPYQLGYGESGEANIPPYSTLIFKLQLQGVSN